MLFLLNKQPKNDWTKNQQKDGRKKPNLTFCLCICLFCCMDECYMIFSSPQLHIFPAIHKSSNNNNKWKKRIFLHFVFAVSLSLYLFLFHSRFILSYYCIRVLLVKLEIGELVVVAAAASVRTVKSVHLWSITVRNEKLLKLQTKQTNNNIAFVVGVPVCGKCELWMCADIFAFFRLNMLYFVLSYQNHNRIISTLIKQITCNFYFLFFYSFCYFVAFVLFSGLISFYLFPSLAHYVQIVILIQLIFCSFSLSVKFHLCSEKNVYLRFSSEWSSVLSLTYCILALQCVWIV